MDSLVNKKALKNGIIVNSVVSFSLYFVFIVTSLAVFDYLFRYNMALCPKSIVTYLSIVFLSIFAYFAVFRASILKLVTNKAVKPMNKIVSETHSFINKHRLLEMFTKNLMSMVENNEGVGMWVKDEEDRYVYANKALRDILFYGMDMYEMVGKTDGEIVGKVEDYSKFEEMLNTITYRDYPYIDSSEYLTGKGICNVTDIITRVHKDSCRFYEEVNGKSLDVYKSPLIGVEGKVIGTVGTLFDITHSKDIKVAGLILMEKEDRAYKINGSNNYFIRDYKFGEYI